MSCDNSRSPESGINSEEIVLNSTSEEGIILFEKNSGKNLLIQDSNFQYEDKELSLNELLNKYDEVLFLSFKNKSIVKQVQSSQKVKIWYSEILESNPPIYKVEQLEVSEGQ
ncbi:DUF3221 domain-containing protein [Ureibacillus sp. 179-F W5.1 NHS]|uniref:DUF3221 domain-containing protein n=1 Tax=unclassified Ureibacillus TaxID=2638520 RepID=UPI00387A5AE7